MPELKTATEAYLHWIQCERYIEDDGPEDAFYTATLVLQLAKKEDIPLEDLIPNPEHRVKIDAYAREYGTASEAWDRPDDDPWHVEDH